VVPGVDVVSPETIFNEKIVLLQYRKVLKGAPGGGGE